MPLMGLANRRGKPKYCHIHICMVFKIASEDLDDGVSHGDFYHGSRDGKRATQGNRMEHRQTLQETEHVLLFAKMKHFHENRKASMITLFKYLKGCPTEEGQDLFSVIPECRTCNNRLKLKEARFWLNISRA